MGEKISRIAVSSLTTVMHLDDDGDPAQTGGPHALQLDAKAMPRVPVVLDDVPAGRPCLGPGNQSRLTKIGQKR